MIGSTVSHYRIIEKLGEGGMGVVYKAEDVRLKRHVAIKFLPKRLSAYGEERERFIHEAQAASSLNHPSICVIHEIDEVNGETFMVMEYIDGVTLREWIRKHAAEEEVSRRSRVRDCITIATQIAEGLEKAHERGIIHRDIKSDNVMLTSDAHAKIMDFGLAKLRGVSKLTKTGSTVGTVAYMSPEQAEGIETDHRTDIFSFGVVLHEMLTGRLPFSAEHEAAMIYAVINTDPPPIVDPSRGIDEELGRIVMKCLEKDRDERYQSMREVAVDLKRYRRDSEGRHVERVPVPAGEAGRSILKKPWAIAGAVALIALAALAVWLIFSGRGGPIDSIAVLPFVNVGADSSTEYLSDGITESIINDLTALTRQVKLRVVPRSTVFHYKGKDVDPQKAGRELNVRAVLTGRFTQRGENVNIQTELIDVAGESQLWGEQFKGKISDIASLQGDISREIAGKLRLRISGEAERELSKRSTANTEAYRLYLKGRYYWNRRTKADLNRSVDCYKEAIVRDPSYALAYSGLAEAYDILSEFPPFLQPSATNLQRAVEAAQKALELDPRLAQAHSALALAMFYRWDFTGAEEEFAKAIELDPAYATTRHWHAYLELVRGRRDEAVAEITKAQELEPLSLIISTNAADMFGLLRQYDRAVETCRKVLEIDSSFMAVHMTLSNIYWMQQKYEEALNEWRMEAALSGDTSEVRVIAAVSRAYKTGGVKAALRAMIGSLEGEASLSYWIAQKYALLGERDHAFECLERAFNQRDYGVLYLDIDPAMDGLRTDPRFAEMVKRIGTLR